MSLEREFKWWVIRSKIAVKEKKKVLNLKTEIEEWETQRWREKPGGISG